MTAEIAVMNKTAIALAADSAVTIGNDEQTPKIFNTVNKLFALSKYHPVAIMVYGGAEFMSLPWETIIKIYRNELGERSFSHIEDYLNDFVAFLEKSQSVFRNDEKIGYFLSLLTSFYIQINKEINQEVEKRFSSTNKKITENEIRQICDEVIDNHYQILRAEKNLSGFTSQFASRVLRKYSKPLASMKDAIFQDIPLSPRAKSKLRTVSGWVFTRNHFAWSGSSGVVIAGFGDDDNYPQLIEFTAEGVIENKLRYRHERDRKIGDQMSSTIIPFAQSEVVASFIDGIDPNLNSIIDSFHQELFRIYPKILIDCIPNLDTKIKQGALKKAQSVSKRILKEYTEKLNDYRRVNMIDPIIKTVDVIPKDELAAIAEALVNLTSFKRRFSIGAETVGGPIDVAVISKGDGLVWIKRKQYFKPDLNPHILTNYFKER